jgi:hypothetical protein
MNVYCIHCEHACSDRAPVCPSCGHPLRHVRRSWLTRKSRTIIALSNLAVVAVATLGFLIYYAPERQSAAPISVRAPAPHTPAVESVPSPPPRPAEQLAANPILGGPLRDFDAYFSPANGWRQVYVRHNPDGESHYGLSHDEDPIRVELAARFGRVNAFSTTTHCPYGQAPHTTINAMGRASLMHTMVVGVDQDRLLEWVRNVAKQYQTKGIVDETTDLQYAADDTICQLRLSHQQTEMDVSILCLLNDPSP